MKPVQGGHGLSTISALQMGLWTQIIVMVGLLTSTAFVTRMIVLGKIDAASFTSPEFQFREPAAVDADGCQGAPATFTSEPATFTSEPAKYTSSSFQDEEADPAKYRAYRDALDTTLDLHGYIISRDKTRYEYASTVLAKFNITPHHYIPYSFKSQLVYDEMETFNNSTMFHNDPHNLKMFSHRMAHTGMLFDFVNDQTAKMDSWRFFFEDDIEIHPKVSVEAARKSLAKGLELGAGDGIIYLGICGPSKGEGGAKLAPGIIAKKAHGTCTHAYGVTKWRAAGLLSYIDKMRLPDRYPKRAYMYYDILTRTYGQSVTKAWVLGINLHPPVPKYLLNGQAHVGMVFQDRVRYPSFITPKKSPSGRH